MTDWVPAKHSSARESSSIVDALGNLSVADGKEEIPASDAGGHFALCEVAGSKNQKLDVDSTPPIAKRKIHSVPQSILFCAILCCLVCLVVQTSTFETCFVRPV